MEDFLTIHPVVRVVSGSGAKKMRLLSQEDIDAALDPAGYLGSAGAFVGRALELYRKEVQV